jgi:hypothetical protein
VLVTGGGGVRQGDRDKEVDCGAGGGVKEGASDARGWA